ncbi:uncharacterized protein OCT59_017807 [Rhizophagus irregularis]|uniref:uncharacterized protein n=1 Tax=Rhizophagus irregularis TaxID=588596 RepID=UPI0019DFA4EF|nr:hypothetical protein OCT59_017807 [Rhizophagus irregularis]GET66174.1 hypothetical protein GLOIN_2v1781369 [Rhizophagus irregularis DAOM 181602=DAOM 197198]
MEIYNSLRCRRNSVIDPYSIDKNVLTNRGLWLSSQAQQAHMYMSSIRYVVIIVGHHICINRYFVEYVLFL